AFRHRLADRLGGLDVGARLERSAHVLLHRGRGREGLAFAVVDDLRVDVLRRAEDREAKTLAGHRLEVAADARRAPYALILGLRHDRLRYFFLPSLRKMYSPSYFTPLPL